MNLVNLNNNASTIGTVVLAIERALKASKHNAEELLVELGIDKNQLNDPEHRIPDQTMQTLWRRSVELSGDELFGLHVAENFVPATFHGLAFMAMSSQNFKEAAQNVVCYFGVIASGVELKFEKICNEYWLFSTSNDYIAEFTHATVDAYVGAFISLLRHHWPKQLPLPRYRIQLQRPAPQDIATYLDFMGCKVDFGCKYDACIFDAESVPDIFPTYSAVLEKSNIAIVENYLSRFEEPELIVKTRGLIANALPNEPDISAIAHQLNLSTRHLQRLLKDKNTSFQKILDQHRISECTQMLDQGRYSLSQISDLLGFSSQSSFHRAFKRWTGQSPNQYLKSRKK